MCSSGVGACADARHASETASSDGAAATLTACDVLAMEAELERSAAENFAYSSDVCTHEMGYIAQPVYACFTCTPPNEHSEPAGICYSCHITCHADHDVVELFGKRAFCCDCPTTRLGPPCQLAARNHKTNKTCQSTTTTSNKTAVPNKLPPNEQNTYTHNFCGRYCLCDGYYDPANNPADAIMQQCLVCQDWFHELCMTPAPPQPKQQQQPQIQIQTEQIDVVVVDGTNNNNNNTDSNGIDTEMFENDMEEPTAYSELICLRCTQQHPYLLALGATTTDNIVEPVAEDQIEKSCMMRIGGDIESPAPPTPSFIYLVQGWRDRLCHCAPCTEIYAKMPYLLTEETVFVPDLDANAGKPLYETGIEMLQTIDRSQALNAIAAVDKLGMQLKSFLRPFAENGRTVSDKDIQEFFENLRDSNQRRAW